jgi:hypothetical protein
VEQWQKIGGALAVGAAVATILSALFGDNLVGRLAPAPPPVAAPPAPEDDRVADQPVPAPAPDRGNEAAAAGGPPAGQPPAPDASPPATAPGPSDVSPPVQPAAPTAQPPAIPQAAPAAEAEARKPQASTGRAKPFYRGADGQLRLTDEQIDLECRQISAYMSCVQAGGYAKWEEQERRQQERAQRQPKPFYKGSDGQLHLTDEQIDRECKQIYYYAECVQAGGYANWEAQQRRR